MSILREWSTYTSSTSNSDRFSCRRRDGSVERERGLLVEVEVGVGVNGSMGGLAWSLVGE
jgi:hypothetical protein